jgi:hypothetical protein
MRACDGSAASRTANASIWSDQMILNKVCQFSIERMSLIIAVETGTKHEKKISKAHSERINNHQLTDTPNATGGIISKGDIKYGVIDGCVDMHQSKSPKLKHFPAKNRM